MNIRKRLRFERYGITALVFAALALSAGTAKADPVVYVAGSGNEFGTMDLTTGAFTDIGNLNLQAGQFIYGMGFGSDGTLYGLDDSATANLYSINTSNAGLTFIGAINMSTIDATSSSSGEFFALSQDNNALLYSLNPASSGTVTNFIGSTGILATGLAAVTADGSALYAGASDPVTGTTDIYRIDTATGFATLIGDSDAYLANGLFVDGTLYGFDASTDAIDTINTITGIATQIATSSLPGGDYVLASAVELGAPPTPSSVPEPVSLALFATGLAGVVALRRRYR